MIKFCPNCKHELKYVGIVGDGSGIYKCLGCSKEWVIGERKEERVNLVDMELDPHIYEDQWGDLIK